jgi:hypothetical protein
MSRRRAILGAGAAIGAIAGTAAIAAVPGSHPAISNPKLRALWADYVVGMERAVKARAAYRAVREQAQGEWPGNGASDEAKEQWREASDLCVHDPEYHRLYEAWNDEFEKVYRTVFEIMRAPVTSFEDIFIKLAVLGAEDEHEYTPFQGVLVALMPDIARLTGRPDFLKYGPRCPEGHALTLCASMGNWWFRDLERDYDMLEIRDNISWDIDEDEDEDEDA